MSEKIAHLDPSIENGQKKTLFLGYFVNIFRASSNGRSLTQHGRMVNGRSFKRANSDGSKSLRAPRKPLLTLILIAMRVRSHSSFVRTRLLYCTGQRSTAPCRCNATEPCLFLLRRPPLARLSRGHPRCARCGEYAAAAGSTRLSLSLLHRLLVVHSWASFSQSSGRDLFWLATCSVALRDWWVQSPLRVQPP